MTVWIDAWEPANYKAVVAARVGESSVVRLDAGDYSWLTERGETVLVERKTESDLLHSMTDGRWASQVVRLVEADVPVLLLEGNLLVRADGGLTVAGQDQVGWSIERLDGTLLTAQMAGLLVARCGSGARAVADRLVSLRQYLEREHHDSLLRRPRRLETGDLAALGLIAALPGCGGKCARGLVEKYGSVWAALEAIHQGAERGKRGATWQSLLA